MFKLLVAFKVLGGCFPIIVIGFTIFELKNKIVELVKIRIGNKEDVTMKNVITENHKKVELVADMGNLRQSHQSERTSFLYLPLPPNIHKINILGCVMHPFFV